MKIYEYKALDQDGGEKSLKDYQGQVLLIVNTATHCGFTPQYLGLQALYDRYHGRGFEILDFPCNQFGSQAPGSDQEIHDFCVFRYALTFPQFSKVKVNGPDAHPLFTYLKRERPGLMGGAIKWNFTKFLVNRAGEVVKRFAPQEKPEDIAEAIEALL